jgi:hypothetical protein
MYLAKITRLIVQNIRRNLGHFSMSAIGIIIGIASLSFFVALRNGVKVWIHSEDILPLNKIEIVPKKTSIDGPIEKFMPINDDAVQKMRLRPEVVAAYPKMKFQFPGLARGGRSLFGQDIQIEFIGDGIDPKLVADEKIQKSLAFKDYWLTENPRQGCRLDKECPAERRCNKYSNSCTQCETDADCGQGKRCEPRIKMCIPVLQCWPTDPYLKKQDGSYAKDAKTGKRIKKMNRVHGDCWAAGDRFRCDAKTRQCTNQCDTDAQCGRYYYCDTRVTNTCYHAVPALVSKYLIELYNGNIAPGRNWPQINNFVASQFFGMVFSAAIGDSVMGAKRENVRLRRIQLVGISRKAINLGLTVPIGYVKRWNRAFALRDEKGILPSEEFKYSTYSSVVIWVRSKSDVSSFTHFAKTLGFGQQDSAAEIVGNFIDFVGLLLGIVSLVILVISAINIAHTYYMIIADRRREIGVMRAVGANRWDIRILFIGEASVLGLIGGTIGLAIGRSLAYLVDYISTAYVAEFMFKPKTYFDFTWWVWAGAIGFGILFCFLGTLFPANRAAKMEPAQALVVQ